jgi:DNA-binding PadR family transcriptional regulator
MRLHMEKLPYAAGSVDQFTPSTTEFAVLGLLAGGPAHGFAVSRALEPGTDLGRILTVRRPLVYRALDRLVGAGLVEPAHTEPGTAGPNRLVHRMTRSGRATLNRWLGEPVGHIRDMRIEFQLKLALLDRLGRSPSRLIRKQREVLAPTLSALDVPSESVDSLELWRRHNALAAGAYLADLERLHSDDQMG